MKYFQLKSTLAGFLIGIGCIVYLKTAPILGAFLFSFGLYSILQFKANLYTGKIGYTKNIKDLWSNI